MDSRSNGTQQENIEAFPPTGDPRTTGRTGRQRRNHVDRDLTTGSVPKHLGFLAWPMTVSHTAMVLDRLWDLFLAGFIGFRAIAGMGVAQPWTMLAFSSRMGIDTAMRAMISRAVGARDLSMANHAALQGFSFGGALSLVVTHAGFVLTEHLLRFTGVSEEVISIGANYMRIQFIGTFAQGLMMMTGTALQAAGDPMTPMRAQIAARIAHFILSPLLIFGWSIFPDLGVAGAALANLIGAIIGTVWNLIALFSGKSRLHLSVAGYRVDLHIWWRMVRIGLPASITSIERPLSELVVLGLVTSFGDVTVTAYAISQRVQMLTNMATMGLGQGSGIMVGQNLGAGKPQRARQVVIWALIFATAISAVTGVLLWLFPQQFLTLFIRDVAVMEVAVPWLRIVILAFVVMGIGMVFMQSYNTAGATFVPMVVSVGTIWGVQVPLAIILSGVAEDWSFLGFTLPSIGSLGQYGIAWAMVVAMAVRLFVYVPYYFSDRWLQKTLFDSGPKTRTAVSVP
ncbi:MAG: MATE family efflux transporter [Chloroflexota bacterium]|nr:MATE family efflux transporter [Chloroflexota bacterium]